MMKRKLIIAVDFDGTIVRNKWPEIGKLRWFAIPILRWIKKRGHTLILWTNREDNLLPGITYIPDTDGLRLSEAMDFLYQKGIAFDYINQNCKELIDKYSDTRKIGANLYIDDLGAGFWVWPLIPVIVWFKERGV